MRTPTRAVSFAAAGLVLAGVACAIPTFGAPPGPPGAPAPSPSATPLVNGTAVTVSGAADSVTYYQLTVPAGGSTLEVSIAGGKGDADLLVRAGAEPTMESFDCRPYQTGSDESCSLPARPGTYYVGVRGYTAYSDVTLLASTGGGPGTQTPTSTTSTATPSTTTEPTGTSTTGTTDTATTDPTGTTTTDTATTSPAPSSTTTAPRPTDGPMPGNLPAGPWGDDLSLARSRPTEDSKYPQMSNPEVDALRYHLDLDWNGSTLTGRTTLVFRAAQATSQVRLDLLSALGVSGVTLDGNQVSSSRDTDGVVIATGPLAADSRHTLVVSYSGRPSTVRMPSSREDMGGLGFNVNPQTGNVSTLQEPYGAFTWFPSNDIAWDKAYYSATITAPAGRTAVFNGTRTGTTTTADGRTASTFVLDKPASPYLTTLAIGQYQLETRTMPNGTPFNLWYEPQDQPSLSAIWAHIDQAWSWMTANNAQYPFATAGVVLIGAGAAMETQTMVTLNRRYATSGPVFMHETQHQWHGDSVTTWDWKDLWLNEGWTMFMEDEFKGGVSDAELAQSCQYSVQSAGPAGDFHADAFGETNVYNCGARALREIRQAIGVQRFAELTRSWQAAKRYQGATRADFVEHVRSTTGYDPTPVLDNWLGGSPR